jgi:signal transduction histidine kinase
VRIELASEQKHGRQLIKMSVADIGIGIKAEEQAKLFHEFERGDSAIAREQEGTGLGLHLSQQLAGLLGGEIKVVSVLGEGSIFTLSIMEQ